MRWRYPIRAAFLEREVQAIRREIPGTVIGSGDLNWRLERLQQALARLADDMYREVSRG